MSTVEGWTIKMPASLLLGALAPMPPPTAIGPPGMLHVTVRLGYERGRNGWKKGR